MTAARALTANEGNAIIMVDMNDMPILLRLLRVVSWLGPTKAVRRRFWRWSKTFVYGLQARRRGSIGRGVGFLGPTRVNRKTVIGDFSGIGGLTVAGDGEVRIGHNCHLAPDILILTQNHDYDDGAQIPYGDKFHRKTVTIDDFVWIGQRVTILPGTSIGEGAIIQGGAVVHGKIPPMAIAGGNPAKVFAMRNEARFRDLKSRGCYEK